MSSLDNFIRKLRKKLRQIENLERLKRSLTDDERLKVSSKYKIREQLQIALNERQEDGESDERQIVESTSGEGRQAQSEVRGGGDRGQATDPSSHGLTEEHDQSDKQKTLTSSIDTRTQKGNQTQQRDQGDTKKQEPKVKKVKPQLSESYCQISFLDGHYDLITSLVVIGNNLVTARDTTLKYWDFSNSREIRSYGGHTKAVTSLLVLEKADELTLPENDKLLVSGSLDSTFKLWSLNSGELLKSVYTYNPVVHVAYCFPVSRLITGSDGGKLELWNMASGENTFSSLVHNASVTGLKVSDNTVYSSASDGVIRIHQVTDDGQLACVFVSEDVKTSSGNPLTTRHIRCLEIHQDILFFGDDARNVKVLDWKKGLVSKLPNHTNNFTSTDALSCHDDFLISSSYDLDQGWGYINVRSSKTLEYLATIDYESTERIVCLDFGFSSSKNLVVATGGSELKLWELLPAEEGKKRQEMYVDFVKLEYRPALAQPAVDSEEESSSEDDSDDEVNRGGILRRGSRKSDAVVGGWLPWCSIL